MYPTGIASTAIESPTVNFLPSHYGTIFVQTPSLSLGATIGDVTLANIGGKLEILEHVEFIPTNVHPTFDGPFDLSSDGKWHDRIATAVTFFSTGPNGMPAVGPTISSPQDLLWKSNAADSTTTGWNEFVTDNPITVAVTSSLDGWIVTTTDNGVSFSQPFAASTDVASIFSNSGSNIPWSPTVPGTLTVVLSGTVTLTAADVTAGSKSFLVTVYDNDLLGDDPLVSVWITVPTSNGDPAGGMKTSFRTTATLLNIAHEVAGPLGSSSESTAEVFFVGPDGLFSNIISITAD